MYVCMYIHTCMYTCYMYIYIYICTHIHIPSGTSVLHHRSVKYACVIWYLRAHNMAALLSNTAFWILGNWYQSACGPLATHTTDQIFECRTPGKNWRDFGGYEQSGDEATAYVCTYVYIDSWAEWRTGHCICICMCMHACPHLRTSRVEVRTLYMCACVYIIHTRIRRDTINT